MLVGTAPLKLGSHVVFTDGADAQLTAIEVDESWEILNLVVSKGLFRWRQRVHFEASGFPVRATREEPSKTSIVRDEFR